HRLWLAFVCFTLLPAAPARLPRDDRRLFGNSWRGRRSPRRPALERARLRRGPVPGLRTVGRERQRPGVPPAAEPAAADAGLAADRALGWARGLRAHLGLIERAGGVVLVAMGVLLFTGQLTMINVWAIRTFGLGLAL